MTKQCPRCSRVFRQKCHLDDHLKKKKQCTSDDNPVLAEMANMRREIESLRKELSTANIQVNSNNNNTTNNEVAGGAPTASISTSTTSVMMTIRS